MVEDILWMDFGKGQPIDYERMFLQEAVDVAAVDGSIECTGAAGLVTRRCLKQVTLANYKHTSRRDKHSLSKHTFHLCHQQCRLNNIAIINYYASHTMLTFSTTVYFFVYVKKKYQNIQLH